MHTAKFKKKFFLRKHESGEKPIHRDREFKNEVRMKEKNNKVKSWYRKGNRHDSVMFIPITPGSVLKGRIQKRLEGGQLNIKLVEFTGPKISEIVRQRVGGGSQERCGQDCLVCNGETGGRCRKRSAVYKIWCRTCAAEGVKSVYVGETGNCCYQRAQSHLQDFRSNNPETREKSVLRKHVNAVHGGNEESVEFEMKVIKIFKNDPTGRQVMEGIAIRELEADHILNSKDEFHQPGELIPVLEGARRSNRRQNNNNNYNNSHNDNSSNSQNDNSSNSQNDNSSNSQNDNSNNSQGVRTRSQRKVTAVVTTGGGGVTTRARARRENIVVN